MLATVQDVKRWLRMLDQDIDADIAPLLEAASEWFAGPNTAISFLHRIYDAVGTVVDSFYDKLEGSILYLKSPNASAIAINAFYQASDPNPAVLVANQHFQVTGPGRVRLFFSGVALDLQIGGVGALIKVEPRTIARIEATYTATVGVPAPVREAIAMSAASMYLTGPTVVSGLSSERLGDYSYTKNVNAQGIPEQALVMARPHRLALVRTTP